MKASRLMLRKWSDIIYLVFGPIVAACGMALFLTPAKIAGGGATGIATIFFYLFGINQGIVLMCVNIPLIILGMKVFGYKYGIKTLVGTFMLSFWVGIIENLSGNAGFLEVSEPINVMMSAIFGGILLGAGIAITMKSGFNTGGADIVSQVVAYYTPLSIGSIQFLFNVAIIIMSGIFLGKQAMLFSIIGMFCCSQMINFVLTGLGTGMAKSVYIISDYRSAIISRRVIEELGHSGTVFHGTGMYTHASHDMLLVVVPNHQLQKLLNIVYDEDSSAFVFINEAYKVLGFGYSSLKGALDREED